MFCVKGFAGGACAERYSGSADAAIAVIVIAATAAAAKRAGSSGELRTFATGEPLKEGLTRKTGKELIGGGWLHFPLWIKVPPANLPPAISSRRCFPRRLPQEMAANQYPKPE
jgi:hypothetical protein